MPGGLDFYYSGKSDANHLLSFLKGTVAVKETLSKRLISADEHSNTYNYKFSLYAEVCHISFNTAYTDHCDSWCS
jgi:nonsense-mediated mRNA decay protein 3